MFDVRRLHGIVTVLNTPFTITDKVDLEALQSHVAYAIDAGVSGLLVPALASEVNKLTPAERVAVVKATLEVADGRVPVIGGTSAQDRQERKRVAQEMIALGCDGILALIPYTIDKDLIEQMQELATLEPGFIMLLATGH